MTCHYIVCMCVCFFFGFLKSVFFYLCVVTTEGLLSSESELAVNPLAVSEEGKEEEEEDGVQKWK